MKKLNKICNTCGNQHDMRPTEARAWVETDNGLKMTIGYFWECKCGSTMFEGVMSQDERKQFFSDLKKRLMSA